MDLLSWKSTQRAEERAEWSTEPSKRSETDGRSGYDGSRGEGGQVGMREAMEAGSEGEGMGWCKERAASAVGGSAAQLGVP